LRKKSTVEVEFFFFFFFATISSLSFHHHHYHHHHHHHRFLPFFSTSIIHTLTFSTMTSGPDTPLTVRYSVGGN